jgi:hypothetical protein
MLTVIASNLTDGPLITGPITAPAVNAAVAQAEQDQPEGALLQLEIGNLGAAAQFYATQLNTLWAQGKIVDPVTGARPQAWPQQSRIATGNDTTGTVVLQWVKGQPWVVPLILALLALAVVLYFALKQSPYTLSAAPPPSTGRQFLDWVLGNWPWLLLGGAVIVVTPAVLKRAVETRTEWRELEES